MSSKNDCDQQAEDFGFGSRPSPAHAQLTAIDAAAQRRKLLVGLAKGSAVVLAAKPVQTLAAETSFTVDGKVCSISGMQSAAHSLPTAKNTCYGYSPGKYKKLENWPVGLKPLANKPCRAYFTKWAGDPAVTLIGVMQDHEDTDEFHWIAAWLNASGGAPGYFYYPYTAEQVLAFYNAGKGTSTYQNALTFFKTYMETHPA